MKRTCIICGLLTVVLNALSAGAIEETASRDPNHIWFDYTSYAYVLRLYVNDQGLVDYAELQTNRDDLDQFVREMDGLSPTEYERWPAAARIAFWINAYNAHLLRIVLDHYPIDTTAVRPDYPKNSIQQIPGVWEQIHFPVMQQLTTLNEIEQEFLRKQFTEPRFHFALAAGTKGFPPLQRDPYVGFRLDEQLDQQARKLIRSPETFRIESDRCQIEITPLFKWFPEDFILWTEQERPSGHSKSEWAVHLFLRKYLPPNHPYFKIAETCTVKFLDYDWSLNELPPPPPLDDSPTEY